MGHFNSVTVKHKGKFHNIPSVIDGKQRTDTEAKKILLSRGAGLGAAFSDVKTAVQAAKIKSQNQGRGGKAKAGQLGRSRPRR